MESLVLNAVPNIWAKIDHRAEEGPKAARIGTEGQRLGGRETRDEEVQDEEGVRQLSLTDLHGEEDDWGDNEDFKEEYPHLHAELLGGVEQAGTLYRQATNRNKGRRVISASGPAAGGTSGIRSQQEAPVGVDRDRAVAIGR